MSEQQDHVTGAVVRITEVVGSSPNSFSDAVRNAVKAAAETVRGIRGVEVVSSNGKHSGILIVVVAVQATSLSGWWACRSHGDRLVCALIFGCPRRRSPRVRS